jgi:hypothetical protein
VLVYDCFDFVYSLVVAIVSHWLQLYLCALRLGSDRVLSDFRRQKNGKSVEDDGTDSLHAVSEYSYIRQ